MKSNGDNNSLNKFTISSKINFNKNLTLSHIKRNKSPKYYIKKDNIKKVKIKDNSPKKYKSNYENSIYNINSLINKMNSLKQLMYRTSDLKSMLILNKFGLKYSNDLRKNINSAKQYLNNPNSSKNNLNDYLDIIKQRKSTDMNSTYFRNSANSVKNNVKRKKGKDYFNYFGRIFDLTSITKNKKEKEYDQTFLDNEKKEKKLYHLKTELYMLENKNKLKDVYVCENHLNKNLTFIRDDINKDNYYSQVKSKFQRKIRSGTKRNVLFKKNIDDKLKDSDKNNLSKNLITEQSNNILQIKINNNNKSDIEESIKPNKKIIYYKDKINSYNFKKKKIKMSRKKKKKNNKSNIQNSCNLNNNYIHKNPNKKNKIKSCSVTRTSNITGYNNSIIPNVKYTKKTITHLTTSNNSQENTSINSLNLSLQTNLLLYPKNRNSMKLTKSLMNNNNIKSESINRKSLIKPKKNYLIDKLNNIMDKSNRIKNKFENDETIKDKKDFFKKFTFNHIIDHGVDVKKINNFFNFPKREDIDEEIVTKEKVEKVKAIMDKKCSKLLDKILNEIYFRERRLNKDYLGLSSYEKKLLKIKRENDIKKIGNESVLIEKSLNKDRILDIFTTENKEMINMLKENYTYADDTIENIYEKSKILKY
jgi:hypothetical protein